MKNVDYKIIEKCIKDEKYDPSEIMFLLWTCQRAPEKILLKAHFKVKKIMKMTSQDLTHKWKKLLKNSSILSYKYTVNYKKFHIYFIFLSQHIVEFMLLHYKKNWKNIFFSKIQFSRILNIKNAILKLHTWNLCLADWKTGSMKICRKCNK